MQECEILDNLKIEKYYQVEVYYIFCILCQNNSENLSGFNGVQLQFALAML